MANTDRVSHSWAVAVAGGPGCDGAMYRPSGAARSGGGCWDGGGGWDRTGPDRPIGTAGRAGAARRARAAGREGGAWRSWADGCVDIYQPPPSSSVLSGCAIPTVHGAG